MNLANLLNAPVGDRPLVSSPVVPTVPVDLQKDLAAGVERRQETQAAAARHQADQLRVSQQSRALLPNLVASGQYSQRDLNDGQWTAGLKLNW